MTDDAFAQFLEEAREMWRKRALKYMRGNVEDAEDLLAEACNRAWRRRSTVRDELLTHHWFIRVMHRAFCDAMEYKRRHSHAPLTYESASYDSEAACMLRVDLSAAILCLSRRERTVLALLAQGNTHQEVAREMGVCRTSITRIVLRVRKYLLEMELAS